MISKAARRYSNALYSIAEEKSKINEIAADFTKVLEMMKMNRELEVFFQSPAIGKSKKLSIVKELFEGKLDQLSLNFMQLLITRGREALTQDVMSDFLNLKKEKDGIIDVRVTTTVELTQDEKNAMTRKLDEYTGKKSETTYKTDKSIIGGFVANFGDTILDASIKRQLELLREKFRTGEFQAN